MINSTPMLTAALSTMAKLWNQSTCPPTDKCMKKMGYIYTVEYYSAIKINCHLQESR
jgi:hypothetical protein